MSNNNISSTNTIPRLPNVSSTPAYLLSGPEEIVLQLVVHNLQLLFCPTNGCQACTVCSMITKKNYHGLTWLRPERQYNVEQVRIIREKTNLQLQPDEHYVIVFEHAEQLNPASANTLLKVLEEPPPGYHFWLLTEHPEQLLDTIRSRCIQVSITGTAQEGSHPFLAAFSPPFSCYPKQFNKLLQETTPTERESAKIIEQLLAHWSKSKQQQVITLLTRALATPPFSGNSKIFWRNLYMHMHAAVNQAQ